MIEIIYSNEDTNKSKSNTMFKLPKNIRQVGEVESGRKVYIEDYVITYINQLATKDFENQYAAVLLGQNVKIEGKKNLFISGAVEIKDIDVEEQEQIFTNDAWTTIYENIKIYFNDMEIVGWFLAKPGYQAELDEEIVKNHINNFAGADKVLFMVDGIEKEEALYIYENNELKKQAGYYIYYEKNDEMQNYMVEGREITPIEEEKEEVIVKDIRAVIEEKKKEVNHGNMLRLLYGVSTALIIVVLVIGVTMLNNYDKMKAMEETLNTISENIIKSDTRDEVVEAINQNISTKVDTVEANIEELPGVKEENQQNKDAKEDDIKKDDVQPESNDKDTNTEKTTSESERIKEEVKVERTTEEVISAVGDAKRYYVIKEGDTLVEICRSLYSSAKNIEIIQEINEIEDPDMIYAGQKIIVP